MKLIGDFTMDKWRVFGGCLLIGIPFISVLRTLIYATGEVNFWNDFNLPQSQGLVNQLVEISLIWLIIGIVGGLFLGAGIYGGKPAERIPPSPKT
jgi:hypothetical protein